MPTFKLGAKVTLNPKSSHADGNHIDNPVGIKGIVVTNTRYSRSDYIYKVNWSNGEFNYYRESDLKPFNQKTTIVLTKERAVDFSQVQRGIGFTCVTDVDNLPEELTVAGFSCTSVLDLITELDTCGYGTYERSLSDYKFMYYLKDGVIVEVNLREPKVSETTVVFSKQRVLDFNNDKMDGIGFAILDDVSNLPKEIQVASFSYNSVVNLLSKTKYAPFHTLKRSLHDFKFMYYREDGLIKEIDLRKPKDSYLNLKVDDIVRIEDGVCTHFPNSTIVQILDIDEDDETLRFHVQKVNTLDTDWISLESVLVKL